MAKRRSDATMTILVMGLLSIALFGGVVVYYSQQTPILRLRPMLEKQHGMEGFETRFVGGDYPRIEIVPPEGLALKDDYARGELAAWCMTKYLELTEQRSQVHECHVIDPTGALPPRVIDREMASMLEQARGSQEQLLEAVRRAGLREPEVTVVGLLQQGVHVRAQGRCAATLTEPQRQKLARKCADTLGTYTFVSLGQVEVSAPDGAKSTAQAGRDLPQGQRPNR